MLGDLKYVGSRQLILSWTFMDPSSWEVLSLDLAIATILLREALSTIHPIQDY